MATTSEATGLLNEPPVPVPGQDFVPSYTRRFPSESRDALLAQRALYQASTHAEVQRGDFCIIGTPRFEACVRMKPGNQPREQRRNAQQDSAGAIFVTSMRDVDLQRSVGHRYGSRFAVMRDAPESKNTDGESTGGTTTTTTTTQPRRGKKRGRGSSRGGNARLEYIGQRSRFGAADGKGVGDEFVEDMKTDEAGLSAAGSNAGYFDTASNQTLSHEEIVALKKDQNTSTTELISKLTAASATFAQKTKYARSKYIHRKLNAHSEQVHLRAVDPWSLCEFVNTQGTRKGRGVRPDTLAQILHYSNVRVLRPLRDPYTDKPFTHPLWHGSVAPGVRALVIDDTGGLVASCMALQMGGAGTVYTPYAAPAEMARDYLRWGWWVMAHRSEVQAHVARRADEIRAASEAPAGQTPPEKKRATGQQAVPSGAAAVTSPGASASQRPSRGMSETGLPREPWENFVYALSRRFAGYRQRQELAGKLMGCCGADSQAGDALRTSLVQFPYGMLWMLQRPNAGASVPETLETKAMEAGEAPSDAPSATMTLPPPPQSSPFVARTFHGNQFETFSSLYRTWLALSGRDTLQKEAEVDESPEAQAGIVTVPQDTLTHRVRPSMDALVICTAQDPLATWEETWRFLRPGCPLVMYAQCPEVLCVIFDRLKVGRLAVDVHVGYSWMREYQVLSMRTHPTMRTPGGAGFILRAVKVADIGEG